MRDREPRGQGNQYRRSTDACARRISGQMLLVPQEIACRISSLTPPPSVFLSQDSFTSAHFIIGVYYHRSCSHTVAKFLLADTFSSRQLAGALSALGAFENFPPCRTSFVLQDDDDLTTMSSAAPLSCLVRARAQLSGRGRSPGADVGERPKPPCGNGLDNRGLTVPRMDSRAATTTPGPMGRVLVPYHLTTCSAVRHAKINYQ